MAPKPHAIDEELIDLLIEKAEKNLLRPEGIPTLLHVVSMLYARYLAMSKTRLSPTELLELRRLFNNMVETILDKPGQMNYDEVLEKLEKSKAPKWAKPAEEDFE